MAENPPRDDPSDPDGSDEFRDMLRDFLAGNTDLDPAKLASAAGLPDDPEMVQRLIGQLQQALQNSGDGINWGLATEQARALSGRSAVPSTPAERSSMEQALHVAALWLDEATSISTLTTEPVLLTRAGWAEATMPVWTQLAEPVATSIADALTDVLEEHASELEGMLGGAGKLMRNIGGTLFAMRGKKLHAFYRSGASYETLSTADQKWLDDVLGEPFEAAWKATQAYIQRINPGEAKRAETDGNKRLALVARRYLFQGAQWAREGTPGRATDYQIWCGPAMGAFNEWVAGTPLEPVENRTVRQIALNLLEGAARITRAGQLRAMGLPVSPQHFSYTPRLFE